MTRNPPKMTSSAQFWVATFSHLILWSTPVVLILFMGCSTPIEERLAKEDPTLRQIEGVVKEILPCGEPSADWVVFEDGRAMKLSYLQEIHLGKLQRIYCTDYSQEDYFYPRVDKVEILEESKDDTYLSP